MQCAIILNFNRYYYTLTTSTSIRHDDKHTYVFEDFLGMIGKIALGECIRRVTLKVAGVTHQVNATSS